MGKLKIKIIRPDGKESVKKQLIADGKMSADSVIQLAESQYVQDNNTGQWKATGGWHGAQIRCGEVLELSEDCFGEYFQREFGSDRVLYPQIGDTVFFVPGTTIQLDSSGDIHLLDDCKVSGLIPQDNPLIQGIGFIRRLLQKVF